MIDFVRLRVLRTDRGYSQRSLAKAVGVDPATIRRLEDGADPGDIPLRVLDRIATALGAPPSALLATGPADAEAADTDDDGTCLDLTGLHQHVGGILLARPGITVTGLAVTLNTSVDVVETALPAVISVLQNAGLALARHGDNLRLHPLEFRRANPDDPIADRPMNVNEARLLRRIHRGEDVRRSLSKADRELTLTSLLRAGLVDASPTVPTTFDALCEYPVSPPETPLEYAMPGAESHPRIE